MRPLRRILDRLFPKPRFPWANANRVADDHAAEVSSIEAEGDLAFRKKFMPWV